MTAAIAGALAARVVDREALAAAELAVPAAGPEQTATKPARASLAPAALDARRKPARRRHAA
jgi:hypothetical protein